MKKLLLLILGVTGCESKALVKESAIITPEMGEASALTEDDRLQDFVLKLMKITTTKASPMKQQIIAQSLVRVSKKIFASYEQRTNFAVLVAIESGFNPAIKSAAGAIGLAQIMPKYARDFGKLCGVSNFDSKEDIYDVEINLTLGACLYRELLGNFDGNNALALVAYNSGAKSRAISELSELRNITNIETANYVTKFSYVKHLVSNEKN